MKERPILFSAPMVRAMLAGTKTQTRRPYKNRKHPDFGCDMAASELAREAQHVIERSCPYGQPGERLWVRESFGEVVLHLLTAVAAPINEFTYRAGKRVYASENMPEDLDFNKWPVTWVDCPPPTNGKWRPSIHMPRKASRIDLEIVGVRIERLNDISEADALAEGITEGTGDFTGCYACGPALSGTTATECYRRLWESINGAGSWAANPFVWCVEFRRLKP